MIRECRVIQRKLTQGKKKTENVEKVFVRLMLQGKVSAALRWIGSQRSGRMEITEDVLDVLRKKYPKAAPVVEGAVIQGPIEACQKVLYDNIDGAMIYQAAKRTHSSAGPCGLDSEGLSRMLCSKQFKSKPAELCEAVAVFARKLCSEYVDPADISSYTASRLIPLDKNPGVRPVGVGEVLRRIVGKAVTMSLKPELIEATGPIQVCAGIKGGVEAAIHALRKVYEDPQTQGILLVDADNAFNSLNRKAALSNIRIVCPEFSTYLINTYREPSKLFVAGSSEHVWSEEGTTQGDNSAMGFYACSLTPLVSSYRHLKKEMPKQVWYADDGAAGGTLIQLQDWWVQLCKEGPCFGYFPKPAKTVLVVKDGLEEEARKMFPGITVSSVGHRYLGSYIGTEEGKEKFTQQKIVDWEEDIKALSEIAATEPQAAYSAFIYGTSRRWLFVARSTPRVAEGLETP